MPDEPTGGAPAAQEAMGEILDRLGFAAASKQDRPYVAEDFVFDAAQYAAANELRTVHEEILLEETPLVLLRHIHLEHVARPHTSVRLRLGLCWQGFRDALALVAAFPQSFQRAIPPAAIVNAAAQHGTGDFGLAWSWSRAAEPDIVTFVSNNVFVSIDGHDAAAVVRPLAQELAAGLAQLRTGPAYTEERAGFFADVRRRVGETPRLRPGERLDLGVLPEGDTSFFLATSGSVNRSPDQTNFWYYRAGAGRGTQQVTLFRVGKGILPVMERLTIEVS